MKIMAIASALCMLLAVQAADAQEVKSRGNEKVRFDNDGDATFTPGPWISATPISVEPLWQPNGPNMTNARWISFADTGINGSTLALQNLNVPVMQVREKINTEGWLYLDVWADDTAEVFLNGAPLVASNGAITPNFTQDICADGALGCEPGEQARFVTYVYKGDRLIFDVYQIGGGTTNASNPFGVLYAGEVVVPEPSTYAIMAGAMMLLYAVRRKKQQATS